MHSHCHYICLVINAKGRQWIERSVGAVMNCTQQQTLSVIVWVLFARSLKDPDISGIIFVDMKISLFTERSVLIDKKK